MLTLLEGLIYKGSRAMAEHLLPKRGSNPLSRSIASH